MDGRPGDFAIRPQAGGAPDRRRARFALLPCTAGRRRGRTSVRRKRDSGPLVRRWRCRASGRSRVPASRFLRTDEHPRRRGLRPQNRILRTIRVMLARLRRTSCRGHSQHVAPRRHSCEMASLPRRPRPTAPPGLRGVLPRRRPRFPETDTQRRVGRPKADSNVRRDASRPSGLDPLGARPRMAHDHGDPSHRRCRRSCHRRSRVVPRCADESYSDSPALAALPIQTDFTLQNALIPCLSRGSR
ncbi:MAG: hypothetical protein QOG85_470 [Gaiellaceae bacterium]|nr:hypothetical protein [Gaiellaceae bacterium]